MKGVTRTICLLGLGGIFLTGSVSAFGAGGASGPGEVTRGELMANSCFACHGEQGQGAETMPAIRGYTEDELVEVMRAFREGDRDATVMDRHATGYSDDEVREIARYLSELD